MMRKTLLSLAVLGLSFGACAEWTGAEFVAAPVALNGHAGDGTSAFVRTVVNAKPVEKAVWRTTALGVYEAYVNGEPTEGFLKPGFTHVYKRRLETTADVTRQWTCTAGATAEVRLPDGSPTKRFSAGTHNVTLRLR